MRELLRLYSKCATQLRQYIHGYCFTKCFINVLRTGWSLFSFLPYMPVILSPIVNLQTLQPQAAYLKTHPQRERGNDHIVEKHGPAQVERLPVGHDARSDHRHHEVRPGQRKHTTHATQKQHVPGPQICMQNRSQKKHHSHFLQLPKQTWARRVLYNKNTNDSLTYNTHHLKVNKNFKEIGPVIQRVSTV